MKKIPRLPQSVAKNRRQDKSECSERRILMFTKQITISTINKHYFVVKTRGVGLCAVEIDAGGKKEAYLLNLQKEKSYFVVRTINGSNTLKFTSTFPIDVFTIPRNRKRRPIGIKLREMFDDIRRKQGTYWPDVRTSTGVQLREITFGRFMIQAASNIERLAFHNFRLAKGVNGSLPFTPVKDNFFSAAVLKDLLDEINSDDGEFVFLANEKKFSEASRPAIQYLLEQRFGKVHSQLGPAWNFMRSNPGIGLLTWDVDDSSRSGKKNERKTRRLAQLLNLDLAEIDNRPSFPAVCLVRKSALIWLKTMNIESADVDSGVYDADTLLKLMPAIVEKAGFARSSIPVNAGDQIIGHSVVQAEWVEHRPLANPANKNCCLFVGLLREDGRFAPHALAYMRALKEQGFHIYGLGVSLTSPKDGKDPGEEFCDGFAARANDGHDFALWAAALRKRPEIWQAETLLFANDSMIPKQPSLKPLFSQLSASPYDVTGLTDSTIGRRHLQSYFIHLNQKALKSQTVRRFWDSVLAWQDKSRIIALYEIGMTSKLIHAGLKCGPLYETDGSRGNWHHNPSIHCWRELIKRGFPFVKTQIIKDATADGSIPEVVNFLIEEGFQQNLIPGQK
ncbi:rhamnan synthesis F family protein [Agrobacterium sp. 16-172Ci]